jgi:predicted Zn-dependent peptidase
MIKIFLQNKLIRKPAVAIFLLLNILLLSPAVGLADTSASNLKPYLEKISQKITEFELSNGMKFIILENHQAPVVSFVTYANVGGVDEPDGQTGVAHFLEHLAFKGTKTIGTNNYQAESPLLQKLNQLFEQIKENQKANNTQEVVRLQQEFKQVQQEAQKYVKVNEFGQIVEKSGGENLNAQTSADATIYHYSFPSNKLELWMALESDRFEDPVFREFFKEKEVILEERRMRTENSPIGQLLEAFLDLSFTNHPYKRPVIGYTKDLKIVSPENVSDFFKRYYSPNNLTVAIVGDVEPLKVKELAQKYFGHYKSQAAPPKVKILEPEQKQTKEVTLTLKSQPWYLEGYHVPALSDPDNAVYDVISTILSEGRTSRLYKSLIQDKRQAILAQGGSGFPGDKYPNLMIFYAMSTPGTPLDKVAKSLDQELERLKNEPVSREELDRAKTSLIVNIFNNLESNLGMAKELAQYQAKTGSWRNLFKQLEAIEKVTPTDIQRVARATFTPENRTIGRILTQANQ